jgi:UDP:flavonoid glycosyltransferase YjiC (YdhE family)
MSDRCNRPEAEATGAEFRPWSRAPNKAGRGREHDLFDDWAAPTPFDGFMELCRRQLVGPALAFAEDVREELEREPADLVLPSEMLFGAQLGCEAAGRRFALLGVNIPLFPTPGVPPLGPGLPPARTAEERALHAEIAEATLRALDEHLPDLNAARARLGLAPLARLVDQHKAAQALLLATAMAFDFAPDVATPGLVYLGPQFHDPAWNAPWRSPFPERDRRPLVLVSFSTTFQNHVADLQRLIDALAALPVRAVVTLGGPVGAHELRPPPNVVLLPSAPHAAVMREASLVVNHGGHGTVTKALAHGLPQLILPHGRDQADNAVRVTARGAGLSLSADAGVDALRSALGGLLREPGFRRAARALGSEVAREAERSQVVEILESLAEGKPEPLRAAA